MSRDPSLEKLDTADHRPESGDESTNVSLGTPNPRDVDVPPDQIEGLRNRYDACSVHEVEDHVALERINTYRLQQQETVGSGAQRTRTPREHWLALGAGKPYPPSPPDPEEYVVEFNGSDDSMHPQNWPMKRR